MAVKNRRGDEAARDQEREARMALERTQSLTLLVSYMKNRTCRISRQFGHPDCWWLKTSFKHCVIPPETPLLFRFYWGSSSWRFSTSSTSTAGRWHRPSKRAGDRKGASPGWEEDLSGGVRGVYLCASSLYTLNKNHNSVSSQFILQ